LLLDDHVYDTVKGAWVLLSEWLKEQASAAKKADEKKDREEAAKQVEEEVAEKAESTSSRRSRGSRSHSRPRKRNPAESALPGWIACLFALGLAVGIWAWAQSLLEEVRVAEERAQSLSETVATLQRQNELLLEMAPPGHVRGILTQEPMPGKIAIISGATIGLIKRSDVEAALEKVQNTPSPVSDEEFSGLINAVQGALPAPLEIALTDSSGRFDMKVPENGDYVIVSNAIKQSSSGPERLFWLVSFQSNEDPSPVMLLNERNAISLRKPDLGIAQPRALAN